MASRADTAGGRLATVARLALGAALCFGLAGPAFGAVAVGSYCVVGTGPTAGAANDGWVAVVTPGGAVTVLVNGAPFVNPSDCAIDANGDIVVVDLGPPGNGKDGGLYRVSTVGPTVTTVVSPGASAMENPAGVAVGPDGNYYVADTGGTFGVGSADGAIFKVTPAGVVTTLASGAPLDDPTDVDVDPRPFAAPSAGVNLIITDAEGGVANRSALRRVPMAGGAAVQTIATNIGTNYNKLEVGPFGNYFIVNAGANSVLRYDRLSGARTTIRTGAPLVTALGITVDYLTADLVIADSGAGVVNVPPNAPLAAPAVVAAAAAFPANLSGIGFSPPLASTKPSTNWGVPTRRAQIPGGTPEVTGTTVSSVNGDMEHEADFFIEVTSTANPLMVRIFDADTSNGYDFNFGGAFDTSISYTLFDPSGAAVSSVVVGAAARTDLDQRIATLNSGNTLTVRGAGINLVAGHTGLYRLQVLATNGSDVNAFGVWVDGFHTYTFNTIFGPLNTDGGPPSVTNLDPSRVYPYFDRGCEYTSSAFDIDTQAWPGISGTITTHLGQAFPLTLSPNNTHLETLIAPTPGGSALSNVETDYGIHTLSSILSPTGAENNLVTWRAPDFQGWVDGGTTAPPIPVPPGNPAVNPTPTLRTSPGPAFPQTPFGVTTNTFIRHYLPRYDETPTLAAAPYAPYAMQSATPLAGDPPVVGVPAYYAVLITVVNPDPLNAMTNVRLTAPVPAPAQYVTAGTNVNGPARATGGGVVGTCGAPCSGNITSTWASIPANSAVTLSYAVKVTAAAVGQRLYLTGGPAVRGGGKTPAANAAPTPGTTATFTPAWSGATFPRTESLGPLCDLSSLQGAVSPVAVSLSRFEALAGDAESLVVWDTASEFDNLGFEVWRRLAGETDFQRISPGIILGHGTTDLSAHYAFKDAPLANGVTAEYLLEDIELDGRTMWHGPVDATPEARLAALPVDPAEFAPVLPVSPTSEPPVVVAGSGAGTGGASAGSSLATPASADATVAPAAPANYGSFQVVESDAGGVLVDIHLPPVTLKSVLVGGKDYTQVQASGFDSTLAPGFPQLPSRTFWVEVPDRTRFDAQVLQQDGATQVLSAPVVPVAGTAISGATVRPSSPTPNPAAYSSPAPYPAAPVEIAGSVATESGGRLLAVRVNPAQLIASTDTLQVDTHLSVRINALGPEPLAAAGAAPSAVAANIEALAASPGIKIGVVGVGLVRVDEASLIAAGLDPASDPRELHLYRDGIEVAIEVDGEATGRLDPLGALYFHSAGLDTRYSDEAVYFLLPANTLGQRAAHLAEVPSAGPAVFDIPAQAHDAVKSTYLPAVTTADEDHFVGPYVFDQPVTRSVATPGATGAGASLRVRLRGGTSYPDLTLDHHFGVQVSGVGVLDVRFDGTDEFDETVVLPAGLVVDGQTPVEIVPKFDSGAPFDLIYLDSIEIDYRRDTRLRAADSGRLEIPLDTPGVVALGGLVTPDVRVWDVTDPTSPAAIVGAWVGADTYAFEGTAGHAYETATSLGLLSASSLRKNVPSTWVAGGGADWVAIAPASLIPALRPLAARREAQGLRTAIVDIEDIYDEISGGEFTPVAIQAFVRRIVKSWHPAPRYLLLVGSATYDYRNYLGGAGSNLVPTMLVDTTFVEAADDAYFGTLDDAHIAPDLFVGRIPAARPSELDAIVAKLLRYELDASGRGSLDEAWRSRALLVADNGPGSGDPAEAAQFEGALAGVMSELPPDVTTTTVVLRELPAANLGPLANAAIDNTLTGGVPLAFYAGHGGAQVWSDKLIFGPGDITAVADGSTLPVFVVLGCLNAFFDAPNEASLGQLALSAPDRGAAGFIASTTVTAFAGDDVFARSFAQRIFGANVRRLGEALTEAKQAMASSPGGEDVLRSVVLLGDPATPLGIPTFPIANPGASEKTDPWIPVVLDGSQSTSPSGGPLTYLWQIVAEPAGGNASLINEKTAHPTFLAGTPGTYTLELTVSDGMRRGVPATVSVDVTPLASLGCAKRPAGSGTRLTSTDALYLLLPLLAARTIRRTRRGRGAARVDEPGSR